MGLIGLVVGFGFLVGVVLMLFRIVTLAAICRLSPSVLAAFGVLPLMRGAQRFLERVFYPERRKLRQLIADFLTSAGSLADKHAFWAQSKRACAMV